MEPAERANAGEAAGQDMLQEAAEELEGLEPDGGEAARFAFAVAPHQFPVGQDGEGSVGGGGFEDVAGEVAQSVLTRTGGLAADVPPILPHLGRHLGEELRMFLPQPLLEERAEVLAQRGVMQQELLGWNPLTLVGTESAAGHQIMNVRMEDQGARPGVEHAEHAQLRAEPRGVAGQILQGLGTGGKEEIQSELELGTDPGAQRFRHGEGDQEVGDGEQEARRLSLQPGVGVGLAALGTVAVVAGMIAVGVAARTGGARKQFAAQGRSAAAEDLVQDLALPERHRGAEPLQVRRSGLLERA